MDFDNRSGEDTNKKRQEEKTTSQMKKKKNEAEKKGKKFFTKKKIIIFSSVGVLLIAAAVYLLFFSNGLKRYDALNQVGDVLTNGTIEVTILSAQTTTDITGYEMDSDYVYVELLYTVKNISGGAIEWKEFPYVSIMQYEVNGSVYKQIADSEADFDFNALQYYALSEGLDFSNALDAMEADEVRTDADVVIIPADEFSADTWFVTIDNIDAIVQINVSDSADTTE